MPPILFLHGFMGSGADWAPIVNPLQNTFYCLRVDLPGHGKNVGLADADYQFETCADRLVEWLDDLKIQTCGLVGYSMGGRLALYLALHHPERFPKVVMESAAPGLAAKDEQRARVMADESIARRLETEPYDLFLAEWYRLSMFGDLSRHPGFHSILREERSKNDPRELAKSLRGMGLGVQPNLWGFLPAASVDILHISGALDKKFVEIGAEMQIRSSKVKRMVIPNAGHYLHFEQPKLFSHHLREFLVSD